MEKVAAQGLSSRDSHSTVRLGDKTILWGGMQGEEDVNHCYKFHPESNAWSLASQFGDVPEPRDSHCAVCIEGRWMLLYGGNTSSAGKTINDFHLLDTLTMVWKKVAVVKGTLPLREEATLTAVGPALYLFGGQGKPEVYLNDLYRLTVVNPDFSTS